MSDQIARCCAVDRPHGLLLSDVNDRSTESIFEPLSPGARGGEPHQEKRQSTQPNGLAVWQRFGDALRISADQRQGGEIGRQR
jgi:hypothetical protein